MDSLATFLFGPWRFEAGLSFALGASAFVYARGWWILNGLAPVRFPVSRLLAFLAGLAAIMVATASPLDALADFSLQAHMFQHVLLMFVAPPLLWLGAPQAPLLRGLPRRFRKQGLGPFLAWPALQRVTRFATHPAFAWCAFVAVTWLWHAPTLYERALQSQGWHEFEHALFLATALLFWFPVVQPWPSRPRWARGALLLYLGLAAVQNSVFSALFAFSNRLFYPSYTEAPVLLGLDPLADQTAAGALMWVLGSLTMLLAIVGSALALVQTKGVRPTARPPRPRRAIAAPRGTRSTSFTPFDLLRVPVAGRIFRALATRRAAQAVMALLAVAVIVDGFLGPQIAGANLAGVLPWTWWRGLVVIGLLMAGNLFCMVCPFTLPRGLARRLGFSRIPWPRPLRTKWLALSLVVLYLISYEVFDLWAVPRWTAWIALAYFAMAFVLDAIFRDASFCKYLCPIGQFHFVNASVSPLEVSIREPQTCASCATHDCIRGGPRGPGCALELALPTKRGNLDCTFCLDCVRACPHDNVGLHSAARGESVDDGARAGVGRLSRRPDLAALALVLVFGAFVNAAGMVAPVGAWERQLTADLGPGGAAPATALVLAVALVLAPFSLSAAVTWLGARGVGLLARRRELARRLAFALVPLGFAMWFSHFAFHLLTTGAGTVSVVGRASHLADLEPAMAMAPSWGGAPAGLLQAELIALGIGLLCTLHWGWRVCSDLSPQPRRALILGAPWALLATALYAVGVWILFQPMEMRGMLM